MARLGRKSHQPTPIHRSMVNAMVAGGITFSDIAIALGVGKTTLKKHYKNELKTGMILANARVIGALYKHATGDGPNAVAAAKFWLAARLGWSERHELSGPEGTPLNPPGQTYVVRMPTPVESVKQWMDIYVPETERDPP